MWTSQAGSQKHNLNFMPLQVGMQKLNPNRSWIDIIISPCRMLATDKVSRFEMGFLLCPPANLPSCIQVKCPQDFLSINLHFYQLNGSDTWSSDQLQFALWKMWDLHPGGMKSVGSDCGSDLSSSTSVWKQTALWMNETSGEIIVQVIVCLQETLIETSFHLD